MERTSLALSFSLLCRLLLVPSTRGQEGPSASDLACPDGSVANWTCEDYERLLTRRLLPLGLRCARYDRFVSPDEVVEEEELTAEVKNFTSDISVGVKFTRLSEIDTHLQVATTESNRIHLSLSPS